MSEPTLADALREVERLRQPLRNAKTAEDLERDAALFRAIKALYWLHRRGSDAVKALKETGREWK